MNNFDRVNELTNEVERFLKSKSKTDGTYHLVDSNLFMECLTDVNISDDNTFLDFEYNFLNNRINKKYKDLSVSLADLISPEDLFGEICLKIVTELEEKPYIRINFNNYKKQTDDISRLVFLIDKEVKHNILLGSGLYYSREDEDNESKKYFSQFGDDLMYLDDINNGFEQENHRLIGENQVIKPYSNTDFDLMKLDKLMEEVNLTNRQKEVLTTYLYCDLNQRETARELNTSYKKLNELMGRIKIKFNCWLEHIAQDMNAIDELNNLLASDNLTDGKLLDFIIANIDEYNINFLIYEVPLKERKHLINHINNQSTSQKQIKQFLTKFISVFYENQAKMGDTKHLYI